MSTLAKAKKEVVFNSELVLLVDILKKIAASHFQALMQKKKRFEKFTTSFEGFFKLIDLAKIENPFVYNRSVRTGVVIVTSDEGFMGGLNSRVIEAALHGTDPDKRELIVLGSHGATDLKERGFSCNEFPGVIHEKRYEQAAQLKDFLMGLVLKQRIGGLIVSYPHPVSFVVQKPLVVRLLPCVELFEKRDLLLKDQGRVIVESQAERMIEYLVGIWMTYRLYDIFEDSKIAEYAARATHFEQSHDRLIEEGKALKHRYFRYKREVVDKGLRETFASVLLRRNP